MSRRKGRTRSPHRRIIDRRCAEIQLEWSEATRARRRVGGIPRVETKRVRVSLAPDMLAAILRDED